MNNRYWYEREALHYKQNLVKLGTYDRRIERLYMRAYAAVEKEIDAFWQKYTRDNHLTYADAQKQIDSFDVEAFRSRAKELVKNRDFSPQANRELKLYNATMRLNRLELLKANIGLDLVRDFSEMEDEFKECLNEEAKAEYKRQSGILDDYTQDVPSKVIDSIVGSSFHNATFSDRIWAHQDELRYRLESILVNGLVQGRNPRDFIPQMRKEFGTSRYNAERLLRTEFARVQTDTQMNMFEENGFDEYIFIANGTACKTCASLNGQHFRVSDQQVGKNAPPVHPNCMCSTAAYMDRSFVIEGIEEAASSIIDEIDEQVQYDQNADYSIKLSNKSDKVNRGLSKAAEEVAKLGSVDHKEHLILVNLNNGEIEYREIGTAINVGGPQYRQFLYEHKNGKYAFVHNHNNKSPLSEDDVLTMVCKEQIPTMIAVRNDGVKYVAERRGQAVSGIEYGIYESELELLNNAVRNGKITAYDYTILRNLKTALLLLRDYAKNGKAEKIDGRVG